MVRISRTILLLLMLAVSISSSASRAATSNDAMHAIDLANDGSQAAYLSLREAGLAGANISPLEQQFNLGLSYLQGAVSANSTGSFDQAVTQAGKALQTFSDVATEANNLQSQASSQQSQNAVLQVLLGAVAVAVVTVAFHLLKGVYQKREVRRLFSKRVVLKGERYEGTG